MRLVLAGSSLGGWVAEAGAVPTDLDQLVETYQGDPGLPPESVEVDTDLIAQIIARDTRGRVRSRDPNFGRNLVAAAARHVGVSRKRNQDKVAQYLRMFGLEPLYGKRSTQFCAAGVAYVAAQSYAQFYGVPLKGVESLRGTLAEVDSYHFYPSPSVYQMVDDAAARGAWRDFHNHLTPPPGWLVVSDWRMRSNPEHLGIVVGMEGGCLKTIEFNTSDANLSNGGCVAVKFRNINPTILGYIKTTA